MTTTHHMPPTSPSPPAPAPKRRLLIGIPLLVLLGLTGNYFSLPLFFGVHFLFGRIFTLLAAAVYGPRWGMLVAALACSYTYALWGHPYAIIVFTLEAGVVGWLHRRKGHNLLLADGLYWLILGMPLTWFFYDVVLGMDVLQVLVVVLKQPVVGFFSATVVSVALAYLPVRAWLLGGQDDRQQPLSEAVASVMMLLVLVPTIAILALNGRSVYENLRKEILLDLNNDVSDFTSHLQTWHHQHLKALRILAEQLSKEPLDKSHDLQQHLMLMQRGLPGFETLSILDDQGKREIAVYSTGTATGNPSTAATDTPDRPTDIFPPDHSPETHAMNIRYQIPIDRPGGKPVGILVASMRCGVFLDNLKGTSIHQRLKLSLLDNHQHVLATTLPELAIGQPYRQQRGGEWRPAGPPHLFHWLPTDPGLPTMLRWKRSTVASLAPFDLDTPVTLAVELPIGYQVDNLQATYVNLFALGLLISIGTFLLASAASQRLIRPLETLAAVTTNLSAKPLDPGDLSWPRSKLTEVAQLIENFQAMAMSLTTKFRESHNLNTELETRVEERTAALRENEERFRQLAENIREVFWILDPAQNKILYISPAYEEIWGRSRQSLYERSESFLDPVHPDDQQRMRAARRGTNKTIAQFDDEYRIVRPDGTIRWIWARGFPVRNEAGQVYRLAGIAEDITERRQAEQARVAAAEHQRDTLVREVHHRIKNNLQGVVGLLRRYIDKHPTASKALEAAITQIESIATVHGLHSRAPQKRIRIGDLLNAIAKLTGNTHPGTLQVDLNTTQTVDYELIEPETVPVALILNELITNALKHRDTTRGDTPVHLALNETGNGLRITLRNPARALPDDFDLDKDTGLGTGLSLLKSLMPPAGARLTIEQQGDEVIAALDLGTQLVSKYRPDNHSPE